MAQPCLKSFFWISASGHLVAVMLIMKFAQNAPFRLAQPEPVYFVNLGQVPLPAIGSGKEEQTHPPKLASSLRVLKPPVLENRQLPSIPVPPQPINNASQPIPQHTMPQAAVSISITPTQAARAESGTVLAGGKQSEANTGVLTGQNIPAKSGAGQLGMKHERTTAEVPFGAVSGPSFLFRALPVYPLAAKRFNKEGKVVLRLTIDETGSLKNVEVIQDPGYGFASAAIEAIKKSSFSPAHHDGRPTSARAILPVRFMLQGTD